MWSGVDISECCLVNNYIFILTCIRKIYNKYFKVIDFMDIIVRMRLN